MLCMKCGAPLSNDEIGAHKKLISRGATEFLCLHCLAEYLRVSEEMITEKIEYFRSQGCTLFE